MDVVVLNEESNMPDREKLFLSGKTTTPPILHVLKTARRNSFYPNAFHSNG